MLRFYEIPDSLDQEHVQFEQDIKDFVDGKIDPTMFKAIRVAHGVYEQRQPDTYMIRIRCAANGITPEQLRKASEVGEEYGSGEVHFTTRQEIQIHDVTVDNIMTVLRELKTVGLSSRGGGGNTIRNILTPPDSGISKTQVFDVDPYAVALTTRMISEEDSWNMPRKFKINFSHSPADQSYVQATCLGLIAKIQDGQKGFAVYCGGGLGLRPMVGECIFEFLPDWQLYHVVKAMKTFFDKHGNRRKRTANRIKFLFHKMGKEDFLNLYFSYYDKIKDDKSLALEVPELPVEIDYDSLEVEEANSPAFEEWKKRYVYEQNVEGLYHIKIPIHLGDLYTQDSYILTDFLSKIGENTIRCGRAQNIHLRNIPEKFLGNAFNVIMKMDTLSSQAAFLGNMINCTGAQTCKLGICLPRGLSRAITERLSGSDLPLDELEYFVLNMSGCPNTCGMHHVADLGFFGRIGRSDGHMYPAYNVLSGANVGNGNTQYAEKVAVIPAHHIPDFVYDFLTDWVSKREKYTSYLEYLSAEGNDLIKELCKTKYKAVPAFDDDNSFYIDFGAKNPLSIDEIGVAECSAGVFDMIEVDGKYIKEDTKALAELSDPQAKSEKLYHLLLASCRMLQVTRGLSAKNDLQVFENFDKHFIQTGLVGSGFAEVVKLGKIEDYPALLEFEENIVELGQAITELYAGMDDSLRFKSEAAAAK